MRKASRTNTSFSSKKPPFQNCSEINVIISYKIQNKHCMLNTHRRLISHKRVKDTQLLHFSFTRKSCLFFLRVINISQIVHYLTKLLAPFNNYTLYFFGIDKISNRPSFNAKLLIGYLKKPSLSFLHSKKTIISFFLKHISQLKKYNGSHKTNFNI